MSVEDFDPLLTSTSTTVIRTEAKAAGEIHVPDGEAVVGTKTTTTETASSSQSSTSAKTTPNKQLEKSDTLLFLFFHLFQLFRFIFCYTSDVL